MSSSKNERRRREPSPFIRRAETLGKFIDAGDILAGGKFFLHKTGRNMQTISATLEISGLSSYGFNEEEILDFVDYSTVSARSRLAHVGVFAVPKCQCSSYYQGRVSETKFWGGIEKETYIADGILHFPLNVFNFGDRTIAFEKGDGLGNLYSHIGAKKLVGLELAQSIGGGITISGDYGDTWAYIDKNRDLLPGEEAEKAIGLAIKLNKKRYMVSKGSPIHIPNGMTTAESRQYLEESGILVPVGENDNPDFWVGETAGKGEIKPGYNGELNWGKVEGKGLIPQTMSLHIKGTETPMWQIRAEIMAQEQIPINYATDDLYIIMMMCKDK